MIAKLLIMCLIYEVVAESSTEIPQYGELKEEIFNITNTLNVIQSKLESLTNQVANLRAAASREPPNSCADQPTGLRTIILPFLGHEPLQVACDADTLGGNWTVIQRRVSDQIDFYRNWSAYKRGFGNLKGSFFIGLDNLYAMTAHEPQELLIIMKDFDNLRMYAKYDSFAIGDEEEKYAIKVLGAYSGDAGDELSELTGQKFTTFDQDNDKYSGNCAKTSKGGWWYKKCGHSNLNGKYLSGNVVAGKDGQGIEWHGFRGHNYSLKFVEMLIRPKV